MAIRPIQNPITTPPRTGPTSPARPAAAPDAASLGRHAPAAGTGTAATPAQVRPGADAQVTLRQDRHGNPLGERAPEPHAFGAPTSPPASVPHRPPQWRNLTLEATAPQREMLRREGNQNIFAAPEMAPRQRDLHRETARREGNRNLLEPMPGQALPPRLNGAENL